MKKNTNWLLFARILVHIVPFYFLLDRYYLAITDNLAADPVKAIIHFTGISALNLLLLSLCISPLAKFFKQAKLMQLRRPLGLWAFSYALCHLLNFLLFDLQLNWSLFFAEIVKRPYLLLGMSAFCLLLSLAITSIPNIKKRMGAKWQRLHNWVYVSVLLVWLHYIWSVKSDIYPPLWYLTALLVLFWLRRQKLVRLVKSP